MIDWHCIELHCHTNESDGDMTPTRLVDRASERGYEAIALTDHNTISGVEQAVEYGASRGLVVVKGIEWTTFWGHIVVTGGGSKLDWRTITPNNIDDCIAYAQEVGDMVTLAHPHRLGWPLCSCCHNDFDIARWQNIDAIEVWSHFNPHRDKASEQAIAQWQDLLCQGYRISALYGYDWHEPDLTPPIYAHTYLGCREVAPRSIVEAVKEGRTYVSTGLRLSVTLTVLGKTYTVGDTAEQGKGKLQLSITPDGNYYHIDGVEVRGIKIIGDDWCVVEPCDMSGGEWDVDVKGKFLRVELVGNVNGQEGLVAVTSPIWLDGAIA